MTVRVGHIGYLNCYPLYYGLEQRGMLDADPRSGGLGSKPGGRDPGFALVPGVPTELNRLLGEGGIDFGPVSSIAYARGHENLLLSRRLSISSLGAVGSIQVVARGPLEEVRSVALTPQSATSVALLKTILRLRYGRDVVYDDLEGSVAEALAEHDAVLLIGDQGLEAFHFPLPGTVCHDLGRVWQEWTGLPMVYAVWAAREEFAVQHRERLLQVEEQLVGCMDYGREHLAEVVEAALRHSPLPRAALAHYFAVLRYDFPPLYREGLVRFYQLAYEAGELAEVPRLRFLDRMPGSGEDAS